MWFCNITNCTTFLNQFAMTCGHSWRISREPTFKTAVSTFVVVSHVQIIYKSLHINIFRIRLCYNICLFLFLCEYLDYLKLSHWENMFFKYLAHLTKNILCIWYSVALNNVWEIIFHFWGIFWLKYSLNIYHRLQQSTIDELFNIQ